jgi:hypothetical protein
MAAYCASVAFTVWRRVALRNWRAGAKCGSDSCQHPERAGVKAERQDSARARRGALTLAAVQGFGDLDGRIGETGLAGSVRNSVCRAVALVFIVKTRVRVSAVGNRGLCGFQGPVAEFLASTGPAAFMRGSIFGVKSSPPSAVGSFAQSRDRPDLGVSSTSEASTDGAALGEIHIAVA